MSANVTPGKKPSGSTSLFQVSPGSTLSVSALLLASLVCNVLAISSPFLEFSAAFQGKEFYSIPLTIRLMWDFDLYAAAILIVGFSLIFPFVKLAMLSLAIWVPMDGPQRGRLLVILRNLGRWSLLDVFIVLTILVLADDQIFIGAAPREGVTLFLFAICGSMVASECLDLINEKGTPVDQDRFSNVRTSLYRQSSAGFWTMIILWPLSLLSFVAAVGLPYFGISQLLLKNNAYSVLESVMALRHSDSTFFALALLLFLVVFPFIRLVSLALVGFLPMRESMRNRVNWGSSVVGAWSMLDVFILALLLFSIEGSRLVKFEIQAGLYLLVLSVMVYYVTVWAHLQLLRKASR